MTALEALDALLHAPDIQPDLLLWTHKIAVERGDQALAKQILRAIGTHVLDYATGGGASAQIDTLVLVRYGRTPRTTKTAKFLIRLPPAGLSSGSCRPI